MEEDIGMLPFFRRVGGSGGRWGWNLEGVSGMRDKQQGFDCVVVPMFEVHASRDSGLSLAYKLLNVLHPSDGK